MAPPKKNHFWKQRSKHGRDKIFNCPIAFKEACVEYFEWCEANPLHETKVGFSNGSATTKEIPKMRAMTIGGLAIFLDICHDTLNKWEKERDDLRPVVKWAKNVIYDQKFTGAAAGMLNANIISRDLGLADKRIEERVAPSMTINPPQGEAPEEPPIFGEE